MLIAYTNFLDPKSDTLELCIIPERLDPFAQPLRLAALMTTDNAIIRVSALEGIKVRRDSAENALLLEAVKPAKLFLTPSYPDLPGIEVKSLRILSASERSFTIFFQAPSGKQDWREWRPNEM